jgi:WD40 repeat protein/serine/threonine protein kinase
VPESSLSLLIASNPTGDLNNATQEGENLYRLFSRDSRVRTDWLNGDIQKGVLKTHLPRFDMFHFCGHGQAGRDGSPAFGLRLRDGCFLPEDLDEFLSLQIPVPRLVFNSSCRGGETGDRGTRESFPSSGLAEAFLGAGCGHYIGAISDLLDSEGREFSARFYSHVIEGVPIGKALLLARRETRIGGEKQSLAWAQYVLYGDPDETIREQSPSPTSFPWEASEPGTTAFLTLAIAEVADSESLFEELGQGPGGAFLGECLGLLQQVKKDFPSAQKISMNADSLLLAFHTPSEAVRYALEVQHLSKENFPGSPGCGRFRFGLHMGEVKIGREQESEEEWRALGTAADTLFHLLRIAQAGQILLSRPVFDSARSVLRGEDVKKYQSLSWLDHGAYRIQGLEEPLGICEVGERGRAPLFHPRDSEMAYRYLSADQEPVLGWRPATGQEIPTAPGWILQEKLGAGGFGEVWKGIHPGSGEVQVFKFCFRADRLRSLKRETSLFGLLKETIGDHKNIVRFMGLYSEKPPYYIQMEFVPGKDLFRWGTEHENLRRTPLETRLEIVAQVADSLQAAHDCGVIHRDVKPSNILVMENPRERYGVQVKLTDFGIGHLISRDSLRPSFLTGFTETLATPEKGTLLGTPLYMAPELLVGGEATARSDIYSLGVILFQLVVGDLSKPLPPDWRDRIGDTLIASDMGHCLSGEPGNRFAGAGLLAHNLRSLPERKAQVAQAEKAERQRKRRVLLANLLSGGLVLLLLVSMALAYGLLREKSARQEATLAREQAEHELYISSIHLAVRAIAEDQFGPALDHLIHCPPAERHWEWGHLLYRCCQDAMALAGHNGEIGGVRFGPDGTWIVSGSADGTARLWDLATGRERRSFSGHGKGIWSIALSEDGARLATGSEDRSVILWDTETGVPLATLEGHLDEISALAFHPTGNLLASAGPDSTIRIWDAQTGILSQKIQLPIPEKVWSLNFSRDGNYLAAGCENDHRRGQAQYARIFETPSWEEIRMLGHPGIVDTVEFSPDGHLLATGNQDKVARLWDWKAEKLLRALEGHTQSIWDLDFRPDGKVLATAGLEGTITLWDVDTGERKRVLAAHTGNVFGVDFSPRGDLLVTSGADATVRLWEVGSSISPDVLPPDTTGGRQIAFNSRDDCLATGGDSPLVRLWDPWRAKQRISILAHPGGSYNLSFDPTGKSLFTVGNDGHVSEWNTESGGRIRSARIVQTQGVETELLFVFPSPDGTRLLTSTRKGEVAFRDSETWEVLATRPASTDRSEIAAIAWSPDSSLVALSSATEGVIHPGILEIVDAKSLKTEREFIAHSDSIRAIEFHPRGTLLATGSHDRSAKVWDLSGKADPIELVGHKDFVISLAFSSDGSRLVTGCEDGSFRVWEIGPDRARELIIADNAHEGNVKAVRFNRDDRMLATSGTEGAVRLWPAFPWRDGRLRVSDEKDLRKAIEEIKREFWRSRSEGLSALPR